MIISPVMPVPIPRTFKQRYGVIYCPDCELAVAYCRCSARPPDDTAETARAAADLTRRARECAGGR